MYGFLITLRAENIRTGLHTLIVHPGFTASNIRKRALVADGSAQGETPRKEEKMMTPEQVAWRVYKAIKRKKMILVLTAEGKFTYLLHKCFPRLSTKITYIAMKREPESPLK
jgi:short-subunit dehydrogenase